MKKKVFTKACSSVKKAVVSGFTIVELITSITIIAILAVIIIPNLSILLKSSNVRSAQSELVSALMLARSEAIKRGVTVGIIAEKPSINNEFSAGWSIWTDTNSNGVKEPGEAIVRQYADIGGSVSISTGNISLITFDSSGFSSSPVEIKMCSNDESIKGYLISLQRVGLVDVTEGIACP